MQAHTYIAEIDPEIGKERRREGDRDGGGEMKKTKWTARP